MTHRALIVLVSALALVAVSCAAAVPSAEELEITGAVRLTARDGAVMVAGADGLPVLVSRRGEVCTGDLLERVATGENIDIIDAVPLADLSIDCVDFGFQVAFPKWSPASTRVAFMGLSQGAESDIWVYDSAGGAITNVSGDAGEDTLPLWVGDDDVVFVRTLTSDTETLTTWQIVSTDSGVPRTLAVIDGAVELGDGPRVVFGDTPRIIYNLTLADGTLAGIHELDVATGGSRTLFDLDDDESDGGFRLLDVHPDGTLALVVVGRGGLEAADSTLLLVDLVSGNERELGPLHGSQIADVRFSSDGTRILVRESGTDRGDVLAVRSTGSDEDAEVLLYGEFGSIGVVEDGATVNMGRDLVLVRLEP